MDIDLDALRRAVNSDPDLCKVGPGKPELKVLKGKRTTAATSADLVNDLLRSTAVKDTKKFQEGPTPGARATKLFTRLYQDGQGRPYGAINVKETTLMKKFVTEYGITDAMRVIKAYVGSPEAFPYIKGAPSIGALYAFRRRLVPDAMSGGARKQRGQFRETSDDAEREAWGDHYVEQ